MIFNGFYKEDCIIWNLIEVPKMKNPKFLMKHIFREVEGYLADTIENRNLLEEVANNRNNFLGPDKHGNEWYGKMSSNGTQIWVEVRGKTIINGGINEIPKIYNPETGLSNYKKINIK